MRKPPARCHTSAASRGSRLGAKDKASLIRQLDACEDQDYFERGLELAIIHDAVEVTPVVISDLFAVEVDFEGDLERANAR